MVKSVGIVGLGLIGGSLAEAIKRFLPEAQLVGADNNPATLKEAQAAGLFDSLSASPDASWSHLDLVIVSVPLGVFEPRIGRSFLQRGENTYGKGGRQEPTGHFVEKD